MPWHILQHARHQTRQLTPAQAEQQSKQPWLCMSHKHGLTKLCQPDMKPRVQFRRTPAAAVARSMASMAAWARGGAPRSAAIEPMPRKSRGSGRAALPCRGVQERMCGMLNKLLKLAAWSSSHGVSAQVSCMGALSSSGRLITACGP